MKTFILATAFVLTALTQPSYAAESSAPNMAPKEMSKEDREEMAKAHEQMAACLRSTEDPKSCHEVLHKKCESMMGGSCMGMEKHKGKRMHKK